MFELEDNHQNNFGRGTILILLAIVQALRAASLSTSYGYIRILNYPVLVWISILLSCASVLFLIIQKPWKGQPIAKERWGELLVYSVIQVFQIIFYFLGLKYFGPIRTILFCEAADIAYVYIAGIFFSNTRSKMAMNRKRGIILLILGYLILFFFDPLPLPQGVGFQTNSSSFGISDQKFGAFLLFLSIILEIVRKKMNQRMNTFNGAGAKRIHAISIVISSLLLIIPGLISWLFNSQSTLSAGSWIHFIEAFSFSFFVLFVLHFYFESLLPASAKANIIYSFLSLSVPLLALFLLEISSAEISFSFPTFLAFLFILFGQNLLHKTSEFGGIGGDRNYIIAGGGSSSDLSLGDGIYKLLNELFIRIKTNKDARNIFIYLCINLGFMFVELLYGVWTNSLGLISDSFHMLFDSMALLIGLIALIISEWAPNRSFTYGYGRVNILSGFINAIFLIFIACSIFYEALHRFVDPPELNSDKLLLVSFLGLCVNLIGLFVFSNAHMAAHGHSHSHGEKKKEKKHGHSHSHGSDKKKEKKHGHSHSHSHHDVADEEENISHAEDHSHSHSHSEKKKKEKKHGHSHSSSHDDDDDDGHHDDNMHGVFLHILGDTLGSVGVIISSILIEYFNWTISDPICSLVIASFIFVSVIPLLKSSGKLLLQSVPSKLEKRLPTCLQALRELDGVLSFSEPHFWSFDGNSSVGTIHVQITSSANSQELIPRITSLFAKVGVSQITIQIEQAGEGVESLIETHNTW